MLLQQRFPACSLPTKALLLSAYAKVRACTACQLHEDFGSHSLHANPQMVTHTADATFAEQVKAVFQRYHAFADVELQQRAVEYFSLAQLHTSTLKDVLVRCLMPAHAI